MTRKTKNILTMTLAIVAAGVIPGAIQLVASWISFEVNAAPLSAASLNSLYSSASGVTSFMLGWLFCRLTGRTSGCHLVADQDDHA